MIYVRNDDILIHSSSWTRPLMRFQQIHEWIQDVENYPVMHRPTILTTEIQEHPECIEWVKAETAAGRMDPQLHGVEHVDYGKFPYLQLIEQLKIGKGWMEDNLNVTPTRWYTPWGAGEAAGQEYMWKAATDVDMTLVSCSRINKLNGRYGMVQIAKEGHDLRKFLEGKEIFMHWWERGERLQRVLQAINADGWEAAHGPVE